jgi:hypothetical protein
MCVNIFEGNNRRQHNTDTVNYGTIQWSPSNCSTKSKRMKQRYKRNKFRSTKLSTRDSIIAERVSKYLNNAPIPQMVVHMRSFASG